MSEELWRPICSAVNSLADKMNWALVSKMEVQLSEKIFSQLKVVESFAYRWLLDKSVSSKQMVAGCKFFIILLFNIIAKCK